jgi:hypothetical protein
MRTALSQMFNCEIEVINERFTDEQKDGTLVRRNYLPDNRVVLSNKMDDNNASSYDFANGIVPETYKSALVGGPFATPTQGPVSWFENVDDYNPPTISIHGAAFGFPRKKRDTCTAVITVGTAGVGPWTGA